MAALDSLFESVNKIILIVGGDAKGADITPLQEPLKQYCRAIVCFGQDGKQFLPFHTNSYLVENLQQAVCRSRDLANAGDAILLAPACASIDMFANYVVRGEVFCKSVLELRA